MEKNNEIKPQKSEREHTVQRKFITTQRTGLVQITVNVEKMPCRGIAATKVEIMVCRSVVPNQGSRVKSEGLQEGLPG